MTIHDHGLIYLLEGDILTFQLLSTAALLAPDTNANNATAVRLIPKTKAISGSGSQIEKQILSVTGLCRQSPEDGFSTVEWFYSTRHLEDNEVPRDVHQVKFVVLSHNRHSNENMENIQALSIQLESRFGRSFIQTNPEYDFFHLALKLIDQAENKQMLRDFEKHALHPNSKGRLNWSQILGTSQEISYLSAVNQIFRRIRDHFLCGMIRDEDISKLVTLTDCVISRRKMEFEMYKAQDSYDRYSHKHTLKIWSNLRSTLLAANSSWNPNGLMDDMATGIVVEDLVKKSSITDYLADLVGKLIIPTFCLVIFSYFWTR